MMTVNGLTAPHVTIAARTTAGLVAEPVATVDTVAGRIPVAAGESGASVRATVAVVHVGTTVVDEMSAGRTTGTMTGVAPAGMMIGAASAAMTTAADRAGMTIAAGRAGMTTAAVLAGTMTGVGPVERMTAAASAAMTTGVDRVGTTIGAASAGTKARAVLVGTMIDEGLVGTTTAAASDAMTTAADPVGTMTVVVPAGISRAVLATRAQGTVRPSVPVRRVGARDRRSRGSTRRSPGVNSTGTSPMSSAL